MLLTIISEAEQPAMTAVTKYTRLESTGIWQSDPSDQPKEVYVSLGNATLTVVDKANRPIAHWSLGAIDRVQGRDGGIAYTSMTDAQEVLEIDDPDMIAALDTLARALRKREPRKGRLRLFVLAGSAALLVGVGVWGIPRTLATLVQQQTTPAMRADLDLRLLEAFERLGAKTCTSDASTPAQKTLALRTGARTVEISPLFQPTVAPLPGGTVILSRRLVEDFASPAVAAGYVLEARWQAAQVDPLRRLLDTLGPATLLGLLRGQHLPDAVFDRHVRDIVATPDPAVDFAALLQAFRRADIGPAPYALARDQTGRLTAGLISSDTGTASPVVGKAEWAYLKTVCVSDLNGA